MRKNMENLTRKPIPLLVALLAVLLVGIAIFEPWWSTNTSPELQMLSNSTLSINAGLFRTLNVATTNATDGTANAASFGITNTTAYLDPIFQPFNADRLDGNLTTTFTFSVANLTVAQQANQIANDTNLTLALVTTGLVLAIMMAFLTIIVNTRKMPVERYAYLIGVLAVAILLLAPLQMYNNVAGFAGSLTLGIKESPWYGQTLATWGPSTGWFLALAAALVEIVCLLPIRKAYAERRRGIVPGLIKIDQSKVVTG